ncbi:MAG: HAD-IA family hydrolase [Nanoarchaeota archaeon]|nr:HAD-IA family hydrolase [Nanoarchaeota archaeon]
MKIIKLIIFDLSNVCSNLEEPPYLEEFTKKHNLETEQFMNRYEELLEKAEINKITGTKVWKTLLKEYNLDEKPSEIIKDMISWKKFYPETLKLAKKLAKKYEVVYLTNYNKDYWDEIKKNFNIDEWFSKGFVSYQLKTRKPSPEGFKFIMDKYKVKPEETIFIDDSKKNVDAAAKIGINTIHFNNKKQLLKELKKMGVNIEK